jgi:hypothetical protein
MKNAATYARVNAPYKRFRLQPLTPTATINKALIRPIFLDGKGDRDREIKE